MSNLGFSNFMSDNGCLFLIPVFKCTSHQPILAEGYIYVKHLILCLQNLCFLKFQLGGGTHSPLGFIPVITSTFLPPFNHMFF